jgi:nucleotide-binding universal stress UspA family protein
MYERVMVGYVDTEHGHDALALGTILARANQAETIVVTADEAEGEDLAELAREQEADLLVIGSTHRGPIGRVYPGSTVERVLAAAPCAVAVAPPGFARAQGSEAGWRPLGGADDEDAGIRVIGVGFDGSEAAGEALKTAVDLAIPNGAALRVYTVAERIPQVPVPTGAHPAPSMASNVETMRTILQKTVAAIPSEARALPVFLRGFVADELIKASQVGVDLLVLGSRDGGPMRRKLHHSVTSAVMERAACPVLISPTGVSAPRAASA